MKSHQNNDRPVPNLAESAAESDSNHSCARGLGARKDSRNDEGAETFQEQYYRLKFKLAVTGNTTQLKRGDDVRAWLGNIEELCQYYGYNNEDSRMFICSNIKGEVLKSYATAIMKENAECSLRELIEVLSVALGAKSRAIVIAECASIRRQRGESVPLFGLRVQDVRNCLVSTDTEREIVSSSEGFQLGTLEMFYCGLRSKKFVKECVENEVKTIQEAVKCIMNFVAMKIRLASLGGKNDIAFAKDKQLLQKPHEGKSFVNSLGTQDEKELDFDGNEIVIETVTKSVVNCLEPVSQSVDECGKCGKQHDVSRKSCPAYGRNCYRCRKRGHLASLCRSEKQFT